MYMHQRYVPIGEQLGELTGSRQQGSVAPGQDHRHVALGARLRSQFAIVEYDEVCDMACATQSREHAQNMALHPTEQLADGANGQGAQYAIAAFGTCVGGELDEILIHAHGGWSLWRWRPVCPACAILPKDTRGGQILLVGKGRPARDGQRLGAIHVVARGLLRGHSGVISRNRATCRPPPLLATSVPGVRAIVEPGTLPLRLHACVANGCHGWGRR